MLARVLFAALLAIIGVPIPAEAKTLAKLTFIGPPTAGVSANGVGGRNSADLVLRLRHADPQSGCEYQFVVLDDGTKPNTGWR